MDGQHKTTMFFYRLRWQATADPTAGAQFGRQFLGGMTDSEVRSLETG
jgi:hypothetical protein